jgi:glutaminyl-peptide cyclotransferase
LEEKLKLRGMIKMRWGLAMAFALLFQIGCESDNTPSGEGNTVETSKRTPMKIPVFPEERAFYYIEQQLAMGPRNPNSKGHEQCKDWIVETLKSLGLKVNTQSFRAETFKGEKYTGTNIVGHFNPGVQNRILLVAHWDTRFMADKEEKDLRNKPIMGADDGASGVAVLLALAEILQGSELNIGVDFLFLDAEDQGEDGGNRPESWCQGAQYYAKNLMISAARPQFGILLDMVGASGAVFHKEEFSMQFAPSLVNQVWTMAQGMGYGNYFLNQTTTAALDDHFFINRYANIPTINIIHKTNKGFGDHWHTHKDDIDVIDKRTLKAVGQVVTAVLFHYASGTFM